MSEPEMIKHEVDDDSLCSRGSPKQAYEAWKALPEGPRDLVIATGLNVFFDGLEGIESMLKSGNLIRALREYWWDTTHTFHLSFGEVTVTPTDFMALTGLSFEGVPLYWDDSLIGDDARIRALLGFSLKGIRRGYAVKVKHLRSRYDALLATYFPNPDLDEQVARTFLWYGLSQTIFADNGTNAKISLLGALADLTAVGGIAWGAAGLAEMYWALDHCCRSLTATLDCFQFAFEAWAYEILGLNRFTTVVDRGTYPAMLRWVPAKRRRIGRNRMSYDYVELKTILNGGYHGDRYNMFPWVQIKSHLAGAEVVTAQRKLLVGLIGDAMYLGERVCRQHSEVSVPRVPHDPPRYMMEPDRLLGRDALLAGISAQEFIVMGADYDTFVAERIRGPWLMEEEAADDAEIYCPVIDQRTYQHLDNYLNIRESEVPGVLLDRYRPSPTATSMMKSYIWLQTTDGAIQQVEQEVAVFCPFLCHEIRKGMGSSKNYPICLPPRVNTVALSLIFDYCRFHQVVGRSNKERKSFDEKFIKMDTKKLCELTSAADSLQLKPLVDLTSRALARMIEGRSPEEIRETFNLPDDLTEEEKLEPLKNITDDPRIRLLNRLYARKRRELKEREKLKDVEVEVEHVDDRSVDDLLSFINGGDGDSKGGRTSKSKKKNRRRKDQQKNTPPLSSENDNGIQKKESNGSASSCHDREGNGRHLPNICEALKLHDTEDDRFAFEDEFDDDYLDDEIDPAIKEQIDREVEDFARRLNSDWPERLQELLYLGQEKRVNPVPINYSGCSTKYSSSGVGSLDKDRR